MEIQYRALVTVGNLHGVGGFAIGKADTPAVAITEASRYDGTCRYSFVFERSVAVDYLYYCHQRLDAKVHIYELERRRRSTWLKRLILILLDDPL